MIEVESPSLDRLNEARLIAVVEIFPKMCCSRDAFLIH